jgi:hypothetical protein
LTAINLTFTRQQACIVTDGLVSGRERPRIVTKAHCLPNMRLVFAGTGRTFMLQEALFALIDERDGEHDVQAIDQWMPMRLREIWQRWQARQAEHATAIYLVGFTLSEGIAAFRYESPNWESVQLDSGVCYCAPLAEDPASPERDTAGTNEQVVSSAEPGVTWVPSWADRVRCVLNYFDRQRRRFPAEVGERLHVTHVTSSSVRQWWPRTQSTLHDIEREVLLR